jgi:hypothetical protein
MFAFLFFLQASLCGYAVHTEYHCISTIIEEFGGELRWWRRNARSRCALAMNQAVQREYLRNTKHKVILKLSVGEG